MEMNFDPMTGEPVPKVDSPMRFDPMTGKPIGEPQAQKAKKVHRKMGKGKKALIVVASLVAVLTVAFCGIHSGVFLGKSGKVLVATANTLIESAQLLQNAEHWDVETAEGNRNGVELACAGDISLLGLPTWKIYTADSSGFLNDLLYGYWTQDSIDNFNEFCDTLYDAAGKKENVIGIGKIFLNRYQTLDFISSGTEFFEIDGEDRKCKGYQTTLDEDFVRDLVDDLEDYADQELDYYFEDDEERDEIFSILREMAKDFPETDVTFYIYKSKLACIEMDSREMDIEVLFQGGTTRMQHIQIRQNHEVVTEIRAR